LPVPAESVAREEALHTLGRHAYEALAEGGATRLLATAAQLRLLVTPETVSRYTALRASASPAPPAGQFESFIQSRYDGICLQGARLEPARTVMGLRAEAWVFDRALISGVQPGGRRLAVWVEGTFIYTSQGFVALHIARVEEPRWEHADLELAPCDMEARVDPLPHVVGVSG